MRTGTAVGLLVGGAVLLLAVSKPHPAAAAVPGAAAGTVPGAGAYAYPGGAINPLNWFGQQGNYAPAAYTPGQSMLANPNGAFSQPAQPGGYQYANYNSPQNGLSPPPTAGQSPGYYQNAAYTTPPTAGQSPAYYSAAYATPPTAGAGGGYQSAAYSPSSPASTGMWV